MILDNRDQLDLSRSAYRKAVGLYVWQAYLNDLSKGDVTTGSFIRKKRRNVTAKIIAKEAGVFAGAQEVEWFLKKVGIQVVQMKKDGFRFKKGQVLMELYGQARKILAAERTLLNLLQRMSGIATATHHLSSQLPKNIKLLATRKTFWGDLDKRAVAVGGGGTHRLNLNDAILIKENHIALCDDFKKSLKRAFRKSSKVRFVEIELESIKQVLEFEKISKGLELPNNVVVMLDNFTPLNVKKAVLILRSLNILIEVSGGIDAKNLKKYAIKGVSAISSGSITNKAKALDLSLLISA
ncbi:carboxylating nicotinate-nucleotide diphosphorylase [Candidatus Pacearchaeota archaeon]|nr:carboxylating nicotinate-nucleotide diphosphorylase [Candidatus Pacearchaeota archaeon]